MLDQTVTWEDDYVGGMSFYRLGKSGKMLVDVQMIVNDISAEQRKSLVEQLRHVVNRIEDGRGNNSWNETFEELPIVDLQEVTKAGQYEWMTHADYHQKQNEVISRYLNEQVNPPIDKATEHIELNEHGSD